MGFRSRNLSIKNTIMALINCPECNGTVSSKASACPHCGWVVGSTSTIQVQAEPPINQNALNTADLTGTTELITLKKDSQLLKHENQSEPQQLEKKPSPFWEIAGWVLSCLVMLGFSIAFPEQCKMTYLPGMRGTGGHPIPLNPPVNNSAVPEIYKRYPLNP